MRIFVTVRSKRVVLLPQRNLQAQLCFRMVRGLDNMCRVCRVLDTVKTRAPFANKSVSECRRKLVKQKIWGAHFIILVHVNFLYQYEI
jgi:hypothetical protein